MVLSIPCLQAFIEPAPCCLVTARLTEALAVLGQSVGATTKAGYDRLVLLDEQHQAIGWVSAQQLLHYLVGSGLLKHLSTPSDDHQEVAVDLPLLEITPSIVEPLLVLAADLPIDAFLPHLQQQPHACCALVNAEGHFLGLLDRSRLLQFLTAHPTLLKAAHVDTATVPVEPPVPARLPLNPFLRELLEHLPLPVMLQTRDGEVLAQNSIWRTQISELLDPAWLRQEVASLLEMPVEPAVVVAKQPDQALWSFSEPSSMSVAQREAWAAQSVIPPIALDAVTEATRPERHYFSDDNLSNDNLSDANADGSFSPLGASACQLGSKPGTCICVCPLKGGREQVLQFVSIPLGTLSSQSALALGDRAQTFATAVETQFSHDSDSPSQLFRLAALLSTIHGGTPAAPTQSDRNRGEVNLDRAPASEGLPPASDASASEELWLILAQDVTEQQQLARELTAKNADLVQLNRLKDEFLACISHELRTPLTAILGLSSLLKDQTLGALNPRQVHYAQLIYQSGRHLMAVVNDILDLTRIETGQLELVLEPVNLATVCRRAFEQAQQLQLQEQSQTESEAVQPAFSLALEPGLGLLIADEQRLRQMLVHLLSNALKFTESHDPIGLKVSRWGGWIALTVWDTGIGIPAEKQHLIFQKFQQLENPLTRRFEGTGLGLVLTQRLARLHGGDVTFISKEGEGSQFTILLPPNSPQTYDAHNASTQPSLLEESLGSNAGVRSHNAQRTTPHTAAGGMPPSPTGEYALGVSASQRSQLVLIVEAVPQLIEALSDGLSGLGYRVVIARSGTEALEKARRLQPCIIFLNPLLPLLSGWDVLTLLKSSLETQQIPVVVMATKVDEEQARQRQADSLLSLPIQPRALQKCLQQLVVARQETKLNPLPTAALTVLRLSPGVWASHDRPIPVADLTVLLHVCQYRILEADDLEQAELLARVWKPNVVLLDGALADGCAYFRQYCRHIFLASLPLVTIDQATSQAANQAQGLLVFPCLSTPGAMTSLDADVTTSALLQVIQIAAGYAWRPLVLALDALTLPVSLETQMPHNPSERALDSFPKETEWLQALIQYLHTADLRGLVGRSWQEVLQQLDSHSVDVLLICWTDAIAQSFTTSMLVSLQQLQKRPPILVLDHRSHHAVEASDAIASLPEALRQLATQVLPASLPMTALLHQIHQAIKTSKP
ncbi:ATP-binding protein [Stenomitos frigidus]|uniref:histidine kinase n=1 Tax=Stenomitos frigidus ULC18 TaxID=2107698 RepID=A0A2T1E4Q7_9CYAN|nr:ATP-binding protein [Stenomitos frigidus]PSB27752.1 hybrid sensor histidine kinase/response regulator [Stenomitos frigidus ULC18]